MRFLHASSIVEIVLTTDPGALLAPALKEAFKLAAEEWVPVTIIHKGERYHVNPLAICDQQMQQNLDP